MKKKVYELIGRATVYLSLWAIAVAGFTKLAVIVLDNCFVIY